MKSLSHKYNIQNINIDITKLLYCNIILLCSTFPIIIIIIFVLIYAHLIDRRYRVYARAC